MAIQSSAPWHKTSYEQFLNHRLPQLLANRLPLAGFSVEPTGTYTCCVKVSVGTADGVEYDDVPQPDDDGIFQIDGEKIVVVPTASREELDEAEIRCVGEQLYEFIEQRLGEAPADLRWDQSLVRSWVPLDAWVRQFLSKVPGSNRREYADLARSSLPTVQPVDEQNWLARQTHLRRIMIPDRRKLITHSQFGRVCPFETPEGNNIGRVLTLSVGAEIRDGRIVVVDDSPDAALGLTASMIPFLEHDDPNRLLMAVNMMRQAYVPPDPEPAYVQTGSEPAAEGFWCGRNLLTAFISWGADTYEDGIVISESCAKRLNYPHPVEPGDKLANRHGSKGTVSRIVPDSEMPHLPDRTAVELIYSFIGVHTRLNYGQIREAILSRVARAEGKTPIVPPFHPPGDEELRRRLVEAGLPESGMESLTVPGDGGAFQRPSAVGWVYWLRLRHLSRDKIHASVTKERCQLQREYDFYQLRDIGAFETIAETFNTRSVDRSDADTLPRRVAAGKVTQAPAPSPKFSALTHRLACAGIEARFDGGKITFAFASPEGEKLKLASSVPHPWLPDRKLAEIGVFDVAPQYPAVVEANRRLQSLLASNAPQSLQDGPKMQLEIRLKEWLDALLPAGDGVWARSSGPVGFGNRVMFSGRTVISPGADLRIDQVGLGQEIAWTLFAPLVQREIGSEKNVQRRTDKAAKVLDEIMERSWVIVNRAPTIMPTSLLAFHPVRIPDNVIRLHPLGCYLMNADFDGDQAAVFLPVTEPAQREAGELLSIAGHLRRDPSLMGWLVPNHEMLWGLALLSLTPKGLKEVSGLVGVDVSAPDGYVTRESLQQALAAVLERDEIDKALEAAQRLMQRGFEVAKASGASVSPFIGETLQRPPLPDSDDPDQWKRYSEQLLERIASRRDFQDPDMGPQLLAVKTGARGSVRHLLNLLGTRGVASTSESLGGDDLTRRDSVVIRNGLAGGLTPREMYACVVGARLGLGRTAIECAQAGYGIRQASLTKGFNVLARAMRSEHPGIVFAQAAATGEVDPLTDLDSRLFVGLPIKSGAEE